MLQRSKHKFNVQKASGVIRLPRGLELCELRLPYVQARVSISHAATLCRNVAICNSGCSGPKWPEKSYCHTL